MNSTFLLLLMVIFSLGAVVSTQWRHTTMLQQIIATQDAVRTNQQATVFPQHDAILKAVAQLQAKCSPEVSR